MGIPHTLSEYQGKTVILNFGRPGALLRPRDAGLEGEIYRVYGSNEEDLVVLGVARPRPMNTPSPTTNPLEFVENFLEKGGYEYPVVMDVSGEVFAAHGVTSLPTSILSTTRGISTGRCGERCPAPAYTLTEDALKAAVPKFPRGRAARARTLHEIVRKSRDENYRRSDPRFSLCGLNCGLCPIHHMEDGCPGCGGGEGHQPCAVIRCSQQHSGVEYCFLCEEYLPAPAGQFGIRFVPDPSAHASGFGPGPKMGMETYLEELGRRPPF